MIDPFVEHLRNRIKEQHDAIAQALCDNRVSSIEEYRHLTGKLHALDFVEREINDLMVAINKE